MVKQALVLQHVCKSLWKLPENHETCGLHMNTDSDSPDKLLSAVSQRFSASLSVYANLARLTLLEARLFATGSVLIAAVALVAVLLSLVAWGLLQIIFGLLLAKLGLSIIASLFCLLIVHILLILGLCIFIKKQLPALGFSHVREAISRELDTEPDLSSATESKTT